MQIKKIAFIVGLVVLSAFRSSASDDDFAAKEQRACETFRWTITDMVAHYDRATPPSISYWAWVYNRSAQAVEQLKKDFPADEWKEWVEFFADSKLTVEEFDKLWHSPTANTKKAEHPRLFPFIAGYRVYFENRVLQGRRYAR